MKPRRIALFMAGLLAGCALVYFTLIRGRDRDYWLPGNRVKELILKSDIIWSGHARCMMHCRNVSKEDVMNILENGEVNFSESNAKGTTCPSYAIEGDLPDKKHLRIVVTTCDSIAEIETAIDLNLEKDTCRCK